MITWLPANRNDLKTIAQERTVLQFLPADDWWVQFEDDDGCSSFFKHAVALAVVELTVNNQRQQTIIPLVSICNAGSYYIDFADTLKNYQGLVFDKRRKV